MSRWLELLDPFRWFFAGYGSRVLLTHIRQRMVLRRHHVEG